MLKVDLTAQALEDLDAIGGYTLDLHGFDALVRYEHLIRVSIDFLRENPDCPGVAPTSKGLLKYHVSFSKNQAVLDGQIVKNPRHIVFFRVVDAAVLEVVRILKDDMDFERHL